MDVTQNSVFITSHHIYSKLLMVVFANKRCLLKAEFFWKTTLVVIYAKILHRSFIPSIYENRFFTYLGKWIFGNLHACFILIIERLNQFQGTFTG